MARQLQLPTSHTSRALQTAAKLQPFVLSGVTQTGKKLGEGSYGCVEELKVNGFICAGKRMYDTLIDSENEGADRMIEKYYDECQLLSSLRHPNIVQFLVISLSSRQHSSFLETSYPPTIKTNVHVEWLEEMKLNDAVGIWKGFERCLVVLMSWFN